MGKIKCVYKCGGGGGGGGVVGSVKRVLDLYGSCLTDCWIPGMSRMDRNIVKFLLS